jgi:hypothetical protein
MIKKISIHYILLFFSAQVNPSDLKIVFVSGGKNSGNNGFCLPLEALFQFIEVASNNKLKGLRSPP